MKTIIERLEKLWEKVPELTLPHLISLAVREEDTLYQMSNEELLQKISTFISAMENQKNLRK